MRNSPRVLLLLFYSGTPAYAAALLVKKLLKLGRLSLTAAPVLQTCKKRVKIAKKVIHCACASTVVKKQLKLGRLALTAAPVLQTCKKRVNIAKRLFIVHAHQQ